MNTAASVRESNRIKIPDTKKNYLYHISSQICYFEASNTEVRIN